MAVNEAKLQAFLARALHDLAAAQSAALVVIGDRLGLYRAMSGAGPLTPAELAARTGTAERYVREWLANQACSGYVEYDPGGGTFTLPEEQALALATEGGRASLGGAFQAAIGLVKAESEVAAAFRSGDGLSRSAYAPDVAVGLGRTARARHADLVPRWIPAMDGIEARLREGARVADVGCGQGAALILLATAFPRSRFVGFDTDPRALEGARVDAMEAGLGDAVRFELASAADFPGEGFDLITSFESLHEASDPVAAARRIRAALGPDGAWLVVEPWSAERLEENFGPWGRLVSSMSALHCLPVSGSGGSFGPGAMIGEHGVARIARAAGFTRCRKLLEGSLQLVLEARR
jgi:ubiquinone/menaquinone biosynthesis C-methylase UbiE